MLGGIAIGRAGDVTVRPPPHGRRRGDHQQGISERLCGSTSLRLLPAGAFYFGDEKAAFYLGYIGIVYLLNDMINRLYDLCIRLSRTNELLVDGHDERRWRKKAG
jgi:hypothetical protein